MSARTQRLSTRIVALFLVLLLAVQAAGFVAIRASMEAAARRALAQELEVGERIWQRLLAQKAATLVQGASLLAADYGFRSAVASHDADTLHSALENQAARIGAHDAAWIDNQGRLEAVSGAGPQSRLAAFGRLAQARVQDGGRSRVHALDEGLLQLVAVPLKAPVPIGWLALGFPIDQALVDDMKALSGLDVALRLPAAGGGWQTGAHTLRRSAYKALMQAEGEELQLDDERLQLRALAMADGTERAQVLLLGSVDKALAPLVRLQWTLALITAVGVALFGLGGLATARRITTPLRALAGAAERLGSGDYAKPVVQLHRRDEVGVLAEAFDRMRVSIGAHQAEIRELAFGDRLTGLPNRARLRIEVQQQLQQGRPDAGLAIVMLGLDRFKHVNDVLGWPLGDQLLQVVAQRLARAVAPDTQAVARIGGDTFAVLLRQADAAAAQARAERLAQLLQTPVMLQEHRVDVSAAFGIALAPTHGQDADQLFGRAEVAMHAAKRKTLPWMVYDPAIDSASAETLSLLSELRRALRHDELRLFLQPKIALASGAFVGAEALVRWQHPTRGMVPPLQFIPFAEQTGFVRQLTLWMFEACAREWPALQALGVQRVSVNLSTRDLLDLELPQRLQAILGRLGVAPQAFCLEITESAIMDEPQRALAILEALSAAGFKLSIDDFGTGYSSLAYLKRLPVDELKIDKSFVMAMERDADDAKIVRSTIDLAHNLGLSVVAEGVENAAVYRQLQALGCDEGQGYHMARPMPAPEMAAFAARWRAQALPAPASDSLLVATD